MGIDSDEERARTAVTDSVEDTIEANDVVLFMKGTELMPECGYSRKAIGLLSQYRDDVTTVNVLLALDEYRTALSALSGRETIPQTFVDGEFVGGSDILEQLDDRGELEARLNV